MSIFSFMGTLRNYCVAVRHILHLSQLLQIHEIDSMQTLQCKTGIRYRPHDLQEVFI